MEIDRKAIEELIEACRRLDAKGLVNAYEGNLSIRRDGYLYITPSGRSKAALTPEQICVLNEAGEQVRGTGAPSSELKLHLAVYELREDVGGVVHAHPPFMTAYALCGMPIGSRCHAGLLLKHGSIEIAPYGRPGSEEISAGCRPLLKEGRDIMLLANHGVLAAGRDVHAAVNRLEACENIAKTLTIARLLGGGRYADLPEEEVRALLALE